MFTSTKNQLVHSSASEEPIQGVLSKISFDLNLHLQNSPFPKKKLRIISEKTDIHQKTLLRILQKENTPTYITVFKIYKYLLDTKNDSDVLNLCPEIIKKYLLKANPQTFEKNKTYISHLPDLLMQNPIFIQIYTLCDTGSVKKSEIRRRFGLHGLDITQQMVDKRILSEVTTTELILGPQVLNMSPEYLLKCGIELASTYLKPENCSVHNKNFIGFYVEGLNEEGYRRWLEIDNEAYLKKVQIAKNLNYTGTRRAFTFNVTDDFEIKEKNESTKNKTDRSSSNLC